MSFIKRKWAWAKQKPLFWLNILLVFTTAALLLRWQLPAINGAASDFRLRLWGMALQLIGGYTVWIDLSSTAQSFKKGNVLRSTLKWLAVGLLGRSIILEAAGACQSNSSVSARAISRRPMNSLATVEERLATLEANCQYMNDDIAGAFKEIDNQSSKMIAKLAKQKVQFSRELQATHAKMDEGFTGNYGTLLFGVFWLCLGIIFASIAPELAKAMAGQWSGIWLAL